MRSESDRPRRHTSRWLFAPVIGAPVVWLTQFEIKYALGGVGHAARHGPALVATSVLSFALICLLAYVAVRAPTTAGPGDHPDDASTGAQERFLSRLGLMLCALFALLTVAQAIADFYFVPGVT